MNEIVFGFRAVIEAVESGADIDKIFLKKDVQSEFARDLYAAVKGRDIPVFRVPVEKINKLCKKNHQGIMAFVSPVAYQKITSIIPALYEQGKNPLVVVLDGITDTRNFGAIARTCECAGVDAIVIPQQGSASITPDAVKTSAGALLRIPVCREHNLQFVLNFLKDSGLKVVGASEKASKFYTEEDLTVPVAIVMGAEDKGISAANIELCDECLRIPIEGFTASLNVSVAAGIMIYEVIRQRR